MAVATRTSPAETKKRVIDALLKKRVGTAHLIDLAILHGENYMQEIVNALATLDEVIGAQIRNQGAIPCLTEQKKIISEILGEIESREITSEKLRILFLRLKQECKE